MMYIRISQDELNHYGVKGMKWGVRHDRPPSGTRRRGQIAANKMRKKGLSDRAKRNIKIGLAVATAGLAIYGGYKLSKTSAFKNIMSEMEAAKKLDSMNPKLESKLLSKLEVVKKMNPTKDKWNCAFTSSGYIVNKITGKEPLAKEFSIDLIPGRTTYGGTLPEFFTDVFNNANRVSVNPKAKFYNDLPSLTKTCANIPDNSFGILKVHNWGGAGHYVNYEKIEGAMRIIDCQSNIVTGKEIDTVTEWAKKGWRAVEYIDCTNATIKNAELLKKVISY